MFALILVCPFVQKRLRVFKYRSLNENRLKAPCPTDWRALFETGTPFARKYEEYFNDDYGLRDLLIRTKNSLDYRLFRKSEKVVIGRDDWLFYRSVVEDEEILLEKTCSQLCEPLYDRILRLQRVLAARGVTLVMLPCPMKNTVYPEMLPATAPRRPDPTCFDRLRRFLKNHPEIITVDPMPILQQLKGSFRVFYKTDFHWTDPAGAFVARELINTLGRLSGKGNLWDFPIEMRTEIMVTGGENASLGLLHPIVEDALLLKKDRVDMESFRKQVRVDAGFGEFFLTEEANEWTYRTKLPNTDRLLPATVMFGDSYGDAMLRAGFTAYFVQLQKFSNYDFKTRWAEIPPGTRFFIFEYIEPFLNSLLNPAMWPEELVAK